MAEAFRVQLTDRGLEMVDTAVELLARDSAIRPATSKFDKREREAATRFCLEMIALLEPARSATGLRQAKEGRSPRRRARQNMTRPGA